MLSSQSLVFQNRLPATIKNTPLRVNQGELIKIVGGNGSGKTTLLKILASALLPDKGTVYWCGKDIHHNITAYRDDLLYIGHDNALAQDLTPLENLNALSLLRIRPHKESLTKAFNQLGLSAVSNRPCRFLSAGQRRRVNLARLFVFHARLWLLDEPLVSIDYQGCEVILSWLKAHLASEGMVVLSLHQANDWLVDVGQIINCAAPK